MYFGGGVWDLWQGEGGGNNWWILWHTLWTAPKLVQMQVWVCNVSNFIFLASAYEECMASPLPRCLFFPPTVSGQCTHDGWVGQGRGAHVIQAILSQISILGGFELPTCWLRVELSTTAPSGTTFPTLNRSDNVFVVLCGLLVFFQSQLGFASCGTMGFTFDLWALIFSLTRRPLHWRLLMQELICLTGQGNPEILVGG